MEIYTTLYEAVHALHKKGYIHDFRTKFDRLQCTTNSKSYRPNDFEVEGQLRIRENTDLKSEAVIYMIQGADGAKGTMIEESPPETAPCSVELLEKLGTV